VGAKDDDWPILERRIFGEPAVELSPGSGFRYVEVRTAINPVDVSRPMERMAVPWLAGLRPSLQSQKEKPAELNRAAMEVVNTSARDQSRGLWVVVVPQDDSQAEPRLGSDGRKVIPAFTGAKPLDPISSEDHNVRF